MAQPRGRAARRDTQSKAKGQAKTQLRSFGWEDGDKWLSPVRVGRRANHGSFRTSEPYKRYGYDPRRPDTAGRRVVDAVRNDIERAQDD